MCCGDKRATVARQIINPQTSLRQSASQRTQSLPASGANRVPRSGTAEHGAGAWSSIKLRYLEKSPIRVRGPVTGMHYDFSAANPVALVEARDGEALLATRFFARGD
jgi:ribosomal protein L2